MILIFIKKLNKNKKLRTPLARGSSLCEGMNKFNKIKTVDRGGNDSSCLSRVFDSAYVRLDSVRFVYYKGQAQTF